MGTVRNILLALALCGLQAAPAAAQSNLHPRGALDLGQPLAMKAQLRFQLGTSDRRVRRSMRQNEYTDVVIRHRGLTKAIAEGCKKGVRYRVELSPRGRIKVAEKIGHCRDTITAEQAEALLVQRGFSRIEVREEGDVPYVATACRRRDRYRIKINLYGDVSVGENLGRCRRSISIRDIRENLRSNGYRRIEFTQRDGRRIRAEACRNDTRYELVINRAGEVRRRNSIGRCPRPIDPADLVAYLEKQGFDRVEVTNRRPPRFRAEACRGSDRVELVVGRYGRIRRDLKVGRCPPPIDEDGLRRLMAKSGFSKIRLVSTNQDEFATIACRKNERMSVRFSRYGEVIDQERVGTCVSPRIEDLLETLERRGIDRLTVHIEGCRGRNRVRVTYNAYGERLKRERIGRCLERR